MKVTNMISNNSGRAVPNQYIITGENCVVFQSYNSKIAKINFTNHTIEIYPDFHYSRTTDKYRNQFFKEYGFDNIASTKDLIDAMRLDTSSTIDYYGIEYIIYRA